jgi:hypothetical protein
MDRRTALAVVAASGMVMASGAVSLRALVVPSPTTGLARALTSTPVAPVVPAPVVPAP